MKKTAIALIGVLVLLLVFGCTTPMGGCYPGKLKSLSVEPSCITVFAGCVPDRLQVRNNCDSNFIITKLQSSDLTSEPTFVGTINGTITNIENGVLDGRIVLPKMMKSDSWIKQLTIDDMKGDFSIVGEGVTITGSWDNNKTN